MARDGTTTEGWALGIDNRSHPDRLPEGTVRDLVNLDPGQSLRLRAGKRLAYTPQNTVHGVLAYRSALLIADGSDLVLFDLNTNSGSVVRQIAATGGLAGDVLNGVLYFCTANESLMFDGSAVDTWGVKAPSVQPAVTTGAGNLTGTYQIAVTYRNAQGVEGGTPAARTVTLSNGSVTVQGLAPPSGGDTCIYMSAVGASTLYFYGSTADTTFTIDSPVVEGQRVLQTQFDTPPPQGHLVKTYKGSLLIADGNTLWVTSPMRPHAVNRMRGFFQYPSRIADVVPTPGSIFVGADHTYALSNIELEPSQVRVYDQPIVANTSVRNDDGSAYWLCEDGYMRGTPDGQVEVVTRDRWAPLIASEGASSKLSIDGREMMVTTLRGTPQENTLAADDYFQSEIIRHVP